MGSFYAQNDSHGLGLPRRTNLNESLGWQGLFENNVQIDDIKRTLGFAVDERPSYSPAGGSYDWTSQTRGSSPTMVEKMIFQEVQDFVMDKAAAIGISIDPKQWSVEDTHTWLGWVSQLYTFGDLTNCLSFEGRVLCEFTEQDIIAYTRDESIGKRVVAQLNNWKKVGRMTTSAGSYSIHYQTPMDVKLNSRMGCQESEIAAKPSSSVAHQLGTIGQKLPDGSELQQQMILPDSKPLKSQETIGSWIPQQFSTDSELNSSSPFSTAKESNGSYQAYNVRNHQASFPANLPQVRCSPKPTIPLDRFRSVRDACQDGGFLSYEKYQEFTSMTASNRRPQQMMFSGNTFVKQNIPCQATSTHSLFPLSDVKPKEELSAVCSSTLAHDTGLEMPSSSANSSEMQLDFETLSNRDLSFHGVSPSITDIPTNFLAMSTETMNRSGPTNFSDPSNAAMDLQPDFSSLPAEGADFSSLPAEGADVSTKLTDIQLLKIKSEKITETCDTEVLMDTMEAKVTTGKTTPKKKTSKHPIHLWEFLKQLLYDGKECIRWIDQEKGVFKIYNSQEVAKFWGERKNRPAMNYDKLSRSIRQYYKKGIIKKTIQGKRLVYQFCEGYL